MARIEFGNFSRSMSSAWMGDFFDRAYVLPGGAKVDASAFPEANGVRFIRSGTLIGRTFAERAAGDGFKPVTVEDDAVEQEEVYLVAYDVQDANLNNDVDLYRHGGLVKETLLPGYDELDAAEVALIRQLYQTTVPVTNPVD